MKRGMAMERKEVFSVAEFAEFSRTTRDTLLHYDKIGLLKPESRGNNNYRYYSNGQLAMVNLIRTCQALGMTLTEIRHLKDDRTPERIDELLGQQIKLINGKIDEWVRARKLLETLETIIHSASGIDEDAISIQFMPVQAIVLGDLNDYSRGRGAYDALLSFYRSCHERYPDLDMNYPVWGFFSEDRIRRRDWVWPDRYYFYNPEGHDKRAAALYAIGYTRGGYGQGGELYERMLNYIDANGFEVSGPTYEEYLLNEVFTVDDKDYLMRVMITVRESAG
jgi:DNA-binding transcriptional MerR regulator